MPYRAEISRDNPTCLVFVIDQSTSMNHKLELGLTKAQFLADVLNKTIYTLITTCTKADGVRDYFHVGVIAYSGTDARSGFQGPLGRGVLHPISAVAESPLRVEDRLRKARDDNEQIVEQRIKFPVWFDARAQGKTSMCAGLSMVAEVVKGWCGEHHKGYPPTVIHVTDGHPTDGDPEVAATALSSLGTEDGPPLLFNLHVDIGTGRPILFPDTAALLPDRYAGRLFRMSSQLPPQAVSAAKAKGIPATPASKGFVFNASPEAIVDFFDIGTRPTNLGDR
jgi:hypothetical protein